MKKYISVKKPLKIILDIIYWMCVIVIILSIPYALILVIDRPSGLPYLSIKDIIITLIEIITYSLILHELRKIMGRIIKTTPFSLENVSGFRKMSMYITFAGGVDFINSVLNKNFNILRFDSAGPIRIDIISFLILAGTVLVIAEVLEKAIKIKDENDFTI
ncbi:MAG TPA: hypothetical protein DD730_07295 [Desulfosporosinus sp.]|jgi:hypothetical protein|nr:hypothetical protein [Desulfosporosinus sp.]